MFVFNGKLRRYNTLIDTFTACKAATLRKYTICAFPSHQLSPKKTALGRDSYASNQSNTDQFPASSAAGPRACNNNLPTDLRQPDLSYSRCKSLKTFFICPVGIKCNVNFPFKCAIETLSLTQDACLTCKTGYGD